MSFVCKNITNSILCLKIDALEYTLGINESCVLNDEQRNHPSVLDVERNKKWIEIRPVKSADIKESAETIVDSTLRGLDEKTKRYLNEFEQYLSIRFAEYKSKIDALYNDTSKKCADLEIKITSIYELLEKMIVDSQSINAKSDKTKVSKKPDLFGR